MHINELLTIVCEQGASDLHLKVGNHPIARIRGKLTPMTQFKRLVQEDTIAMAFAIMASDKQKGKFKENFDLDLANVFRPTRITGREMTLRRVPGAWGRVFDFGTVRIGEQKGREAFRAFVPGGETLQGWHDSFTGRSAAMGAAREQGQYAGMDVRGRMAQTNWALDFNPHQAGLSGYAKSIASQTGAFAPVMDRSLVSSSW